ncbi:uncharacterized protein ACRADG_006775 [Cochliomyia hominivorax]
METFPHPVSPTTSQLLEDETTPSDLQDSEIGIFKIENITVISPPLLKIFYWESLDIDNLNNKLLSDASSLEHHLELPTRQLNSKPLKIVFWLRNLSNFNYNMRLKRIQNCQCLPQETRVGFNQFRNLYHCPHRRLIHITQEVFEMKPNDLVALSMVTYYFILGSHMLSYELRISDTRIIKLNFHVNIVIFDPLKSVLTTNLIPVDLREHRSMSQPIWIRNITMQNLHIIFSGKARGFRLINSNMIIPRQSVWPLIVEYRPSELENELELLLTYGDKTSDKGNSKNMFKIPITCKGYIETPEVTEVTNVPLLDYECANYLYVVYPNKLEFHTEINQEKTLMVAVHNYDQKCIEFRWQTYNINEYFSLNFEPKQFTLKPHHSKLCVVQAKSYNLPLHFKRIPAVLEVHRILDKSTQIAQHLLKEVESIDDPKWLEDSYMEHVLLEIDFKVEFPKLQRINVKEQQESFKSSYTIFEKLFWEYLAKSNHMRDTTKIPSNLCYEEVINKKYDKKGDMDTINKQEAFNLFSSLIAEACRDLSKNYRFIPPDILDTI